jgi:ABC-type lipoprotein export system ATPase subunit
MEGFMIQQITVDGFRSLAEFSLTLQRGPNILVGPNGSGKTNIIEFFQFLARMVQSNVSDAVSLTGGVGAFFRKTSGPEAFQRELKAIVRGSTILDKRFFATSGRKSAPPQEDQKISYEYLFCVGASDQFDSIGFSKQHLKIRRHNRDPGLFDGNDKRECGGWNFVLIYDSSEVTNNGVTIESWDSNLVRGDISIEQANTMLSGEGSFRKYENQTILLSYHIFLPSYPIVLDFIGGETLNVDPHEVKKPEDSARAPGIRSNGSGLSATLWHLQRDDPRPDNLILPFLGNWTFPARPGGGWGRILKQILSLVSRVNPQILSVKVVNDLVDNQLKTRMTMDGGDATIELPLSAMSDGTIKWCALVTAILTHRSVIAIEEPENFLHPHMQSEILKIMRETTARKNSFVIMTTHSESLLNAANPEEVIVVRIENGISNARRIQHPKQLRREIQETGFGLGNYYLAGDLQDA